MRVLLALLLAIAASLSPFTARADEQRYIIALAHGQSHDPATDPASATVSEFKRRLEQAAPGRVRVDLYPNGMVGGNRETARLVSRNVIQSALITVGGVVPLYPPLAVVNMPFVFDQAATAYQVYDGPFGRHLAEEIKAHTGLEVLGFGDSGGLYVITNARRPVRSPQDLEGLKLRTIPGAEVLDAMIKGFGATPVRVSSRDELTALASGIVDGQMNPPTVVMNRRYDQVQRYATLTNHLYLPYVWLFNAQAMEGLPPDIQAAVREAARAAVDAGRQLSQRQESGENGLPALRRHLEVEILTPAQRDQLRDTAQGVVREAIAKTLGEEGTRLLEEFLAAATIKP